MFSLYFSPEAGRVPELFTTCVTTGGKHGKQKAAQGACDCYGSSQSKTSEESEVGHDSDPADAKERCQSESLRRSPAVQARRPPDQGAVRPRLRREWSEDDMGPAGCCGRSSQEVSSCAGCESPGVSGIKFSPGSIVATPGALAALEASGDDPMAYLVRHIAGDWGEVDEQDRRENELSLVHGFRLLSAYTLKNGTKIWIITEADRSVTTVLLPEEY